MRTRILAPEEWQRLDGLDMGQLLPLVEPRNIAVIAVEDDAGRIVGCISALQVTHFEGVWVAPDHRGKAGVLRSLLRMACALACARGESWVLGGAADGDEAMGGYMARLGRKLPLGFFVMPTKEK